MPFSSGVFTVDFKFRQLVLFQAKQFCAADVLAVVPELNVVFTERQLFAESSEPQALPNALRVALPSVTLVPRGSVI